MVVAATGGSGLVVTGQIFSFALKSGATCAVINGVTYRVVNGGNFKDFKREVCSGFAFGYEAGAVIGTVKFIKASSTVKKSGRKTKVTSNLGNEIDITTSTNHTTTTKNPGLKGTPNSSIDIVDSAGNIKTRRWFDSNGMQIRDVDFTNHGNAKLHPEWPHEHGTR